MKKHLVSTATTGGGQQQFVEQNDGKYSMNSNWAWGASNWG